MALVARGRGLGAVPARMLRGSRHRSKLRVLKISDLELPFGLWFVHRPAPGGLADVIVALGARVEESLS